MYRPGPFVEDDPLKLGALIRACPLASLIVNGPDGLLVAHTPMVVETDADGAINALIGHVARANPFWAAVGDAEVLAIFSGPDGYVSPSLYASKAEHGQVVPTWNYARVEARGRLTVESDPGRVRPYFEILTRTFEQDREAPWSVDDAPPAFVEKLSHGIVGLRLAVTDIQGGFKLSQNKRGGDYSGVRDGLARSDDAASRAVGLMMTQDSQPAGGMTG